MNPAVGVGVVGGVVSLEPVTFKSSVDKYSALQEQPRLRAADDD